LTAVFSHPVIRGMGVFVVDQDRVEEIAASPGLSIASAIPPEPAPAAGTPRGIGGAFAADWRRVLATLSAFILLVLAPIVYGFDCPQPYLNQISDAGCERCGRGGVPRRHTGRCPCRARPRRCLLDPCGHLFHARGDICVPDQAETGTWLAATSLADA